MLKKFYETLIVPSQTSVEVYSTSKELFVMGRAPASLRSFIFRTVWNFSLSEKNYETVGSFPHRESTVNRHLS